MSPFAKFVIALVTISVVSDVAQKAIEAYKFKNNK